MSKVELLIIYLAGWAGCLLLGMRISARKWERRFEMIRHREYSRGWDAGFGFTNRISDERTEAMSKVKIVKK